MDKSVTNFFMIIKGNKRKLVISLILAIMATGIVCYIVFNDAFLTNSFALGSNINNLWLYFVKIGFIFTGIYFFALALVFHNSHSIKFLCYCYITLLLFLFFVKGMYLGKPVQGLPPISSLVINFSLSPHKLNIIMPIPGIRYFSLFS